MATAEPRFTRDLPEVRKRKLIEATAQCLAEFGHAGTSVRAVAAKANVSPGLVAHHFKGIDDLIVATYDHVGGQVAETLTKAMDQAADDAESKLRAFIDVSFKPPVLDRDLLAIWLSFWSLVRRDPGVRKVHKKVYADYRRRKVNATEIARSLQALIDGLFLERALDRQAVDYVDFRRASYEFLELHLGKLTSPA